MRIDILTLFPSMFESALNHSILKRARQSGAVEIVLTDIRDFSEDKHRKVDDRPYGGGPGMVMRPEPVVRCFEYVRDLAPEKGPVYLLSPRGKTFNQALAWRLSREKRLILIAGRYEGFDERIRIILQAEELSIGDYVLTGGELPAMVVVDAVVRLLPGVLGDECSARDDSFTESVDGGLEYPQYTRPEVFRGLKVPDVLLSGDHAKIAQWRRRQALETTRRNRPDLLEKCAEKQDQH